MVILFRFAQTDFTERIACPNLIGIYIFRDNRLSSDDCILSDCYSRHYHGSYPYERIFLDDNLICNQLKGGGVEVVCSSAKVGFLCNSGSFHNLNFPKRVCDGAFSQACPVMHNQVPGYFNSGF